MISGKAVYIKKTVFNQNTSKNIFIDLKISGFTCNLPALFWFEI